jgi:hypothetical protein
VLRNAPVTGRDPPARASNSLFDHASTAISVISAERGRGSGAAHRAQ